MSLSESVFGTYGLLYGKTIPAAKRTECFPAYRYCVKSKIEISDKISDIKSTVLQPKKSVQIRCQKWIYLNRMKLVFLLIFQAK